MNVLLQVWLSSPPSPALASYSLSLACTPGLPCQGEVASSCLGGLGASCVHTGGCREGLNCSGQEAGNRSCQPL